MKKIAIFISIAIVLSSLALTFSAWHMGVRWIGGDIKSFYIPDRLRAVFGDDLAPIEVEVDAVRVLDEKEDVFLRRYPELFKRELGRLRITFPQGVIITREDCAVGCYSDEFSIFRVEEVLENPVSVLLIVERAEYTHYELIFATGQSIEISSPPKISPSRKRLVDVEYNELWGVSRVELWEIRKLGPLKLFETGPSFSAFVAFDGWSQQENPIVLMNEEYFTREPSELCLKVELNLTDGEWGFQPLVQNGEEEASPVACPGQMLDSPL